MDLYKNRFRPSSIRLQNWDYRWDSAYFVTVCTKEKLPYFGNIEEGKMNLSEAGCLAGVLWYEIKNHAKNIELGEFVVMPNHIHGVLILNGNNNRNNDDSHNVETRHALSLQTPESTIGKQRFQNQGKNSISSIVGGYKSALTKHVGRLGFQFAWQSRFWEHIIRDEAEYHRIEQYIVDNPKRWAMDTLNHL